MSTCDPTMPSEQVSHANTDRPLFIHSDYFGIKKLYRDAGTGHNNFRWGRGFEYYSTLWNRNIRHDFSIPINYYHLDGDDILHFKKTEGATLWFNGEGTLRLSSENIHPFRMWLYDGNQLHGGIKNALNQNGGQRWSDNLEFTFYFNRKHHSTQFHSELGGIFIHLGSDHLFGASNTISYAGCPYNAHEYILAIENSGSMYFTGEPYHGSRRDPKPNDVHLQDFWGTSLEGLPLNTMIGIKFIKRVVDDGKSVLLECFRDMTEGAGGGDWVRLFEFKHTRGNWVNDTMTEPYNTSLTSPNCVLTPPPNVDEPHYQGGGSTCYLVITPVQELEIKWLSCRDIQNGVIRPTTTSTDLSESGASTETCTRN